LTDLSAQQPAQHKPPAAMAAALPAAVAADEWATPVSHACQACGGEDYVPGFGPRCLLCCSCCQGRHMHVECEEATTGSTLTEESLTHTHWFCSKVRWNLMLRY